MVSGKTAELAKLECAESLLELFFLNEKRLTGKRLSNIANFRCNYANVFLKTLLKVKEKEGSHLNVKIKIMASDFSIKRCKIKVREYFLHKSGIW